MPTQPAPAISGAEVPIGDEGLVRAVLDRVYTAWEANDADAFVELYAHDATAQLPGSSLPDRTAIRATMSAVFAGDLKGSRAMYEDARVRFVGGQVAIVISRSGIVFPGQVQPADATRAFDTWVLSKHTGQWLVEAFHQCPESN